MPRAKKRVQKSNDGPPAKNSAPEPEQQQNEVPQIPVIPVKSFSIRHEFKHSSLLELGKSMTSHKEERFGIVWEIKIVREPECITVQLGQLSSWDVNLDYRVEMQSVLLGPTRLKARAESGNLALKSDVCGSRYTKLHSFEGYINDRNIIVWLQIQLNEQSFFYRTNLRTFDSSVADLADTIIVVGEEKFYVSKLTLASHSSFFKSLFLGPYKEATMPEITLQGVDKFDMQNFLECLYLEPSADEHTVEGMLLLADQYDTPSVKRKCESYLKTYSKKSPRYKYELFTRYNCDIKRLLGSIKSHAELKKAVGEDLSEMDPETMRAVLQKSLSFASSSSN